MMLKRILKETITKSNSTILKPMFGAVGNHIHCKIHTNEIDVKDVQIPVPWGHLAAKQWGSGAERPILALHGWQDNAGTWDTLIPNLMSKNNTKRPVLAIDFPGHGFSSWLPKGMSYFAWDLPRVILYLKQYFKWDKVSILSHSMGSIAGFRYACLFPTDVDFYIGVDILVADEYDLPFMIDKYPTLMQKNLTMQNLLDKEPPTYTLEEIIKLWHIGTGKSVDLESVPYLLKRGAKQSKKDPNKYYISRDPRLKYTLFNPEPRKFVEGLSLRLKCPTLYIKATDSPYAADENAIAMCELLEKNNDKFECQYLPGTHHIHLNSPDVVVLHIINFLKKHQLE